MMGVAAYTRGTKALRDGIDRDLQRPKTPTERAFAEGLDQGRRESDAEINELRRRIDEHRRHADRLRVYLSAERQRVPAILAALQDFRDSFRGRAASGKAWAAIVALMRASGAA